MLLDTILFIICLVFLVIMVVSATCFIYLHIRRRSLNLQGAQNIEELGGIMSVVEASERHARTLIPDAPLERADGFDPASIGESYTIDRAVGSRTTRRFVVKCARQGSLRFLRYIPKKQGMLAYNLKALKALEHDNIPGIIDIFKKEEGVYIVESLVEGVPLDKLIKSGARVSQSVLRGWFEQIAVTLSDLHKLRPVPFLHLNLSADNIMITADNRVVLGGIGITRRYGDPVTALANVPYAAPEQLDVQAIENLEEFISERFGGVPSFAGRLNADERADIYSLGVVMFELATGRLPVLDNLGALKDHVSDELGDIIKKCIMIDPINRFQSAAELLKHLRGLGGARPVTPRLPRLRKLAGIAALSSFLISCTAFVAGYMVYTTENAAVISASPLIMTVSPGQSTGLVLEKALSGGRVVGLDSGQVRWEFSLHGVAIIDDNRVTGLGAGETTVHGTYRNSEIELTVRVIMPADDTLRVSQRYDGGRTVSLYCGSVERKKADGPLGSANFFLLESIAAADDGIVYIADDGAMRVISEGSVVTMDIKDGNVRPATIRCYGKGIYVLSKPWMDANGYYYALALVRENSMEPFYIVDAVNTTIEDFALGADGLIYLIERNYGLGGVFLKTLNPYNATVVKVLCQLPSGSSSLAVSFSGDVYIGNAETGVINVYRDGALSGFAGLEGDRAFIDGELPRFYSPRRLVHNSGLLYVWDYNTLRVIEASRGVAGKCTTLAGVAGIPHDAEAADVLTAAEDTVLPYGDRVCFALTRDGILIADNERGVIWLLK